MSAWYAFTALIPALWTIRYALGGWKIRRTRQHIEQMEQELGLVPPHDRPGIIKFKGSSGPPRVLVDTPGVLVGGCDTVVATFDHEKLAREWWPNGRATTKMVLPPGPTYDVRTRAPMCTECGAVTHRVKKSPYWRCPEHGVVDVWTGLDAG